MRGRRVGRSGLTVGEIGLGHADLGLRTPPEEALACGRRFLEAGGTLVDTAHGYADGASEELVGRLLADASREEVVVCTKAGHLARPGRAGRRHLPTGAPVRPRHLADPARHRPRRPLARPRLVRRRAARGDPRRRWATRRPPGKARYVGVSNYSGWQLARAYSLAEREGIRLVADQVEVSLLQREAEHEVLPAAAALGVGLLAWSPLGRGILTGKYRNGTPADSRAASPGLAANVTRRLGPETDAVVEALATAARGLDATPGCARAGLGARPPGGVRRDRGAAHGGPAAGILDGQGDRSCPSDRAGARRGLVGEPLTATLVLGPLRVVVAEPGVRAVVAVLVLVVVDLGAVVLVVVRRRRPRPRRRRRSRAASSR